MINDLIKKALNAKRESKSIDFKESFDVNSSNEWCELIKDIIAMSNSGGGAILIGVDNHGNSIDFDINPLLEYDSADITDKVYKYTGIQFSDFDILAEEKDGRKVAVFLVNGVSIPMVFIRPGIYEGGGRAKVVFAVGTVYFRHGAKSEPGNTDDIGKAIDRQLASIRKDWVQGVRKIVTAPPGSRMIVAVDGKTTYSNAKSLRIVKDASAPAVRITHDKNEATGILLREELSEQLFDEINNVLNANALLAQDNERFLFEEPVYYRIYAARQYVTNDFNQIKLLASTGCKTIYGPTLFWLLKLPLDDRANLIHQICESPKNPYAYTAIRIMILLGKEATEWLFDLWKKKWGHQTQQFEFYWTLKKIVDAKEPVDRMSVAIRTVSGPSEELSYKEELHEYSDLLSSPELAAEMLSVACMRVFKGEKKVKGLCRKLDLLAYGKEIESQSKALFKQLKRATK